MYEQDQFESEMYYAPDSAAAAVDRLHALDYGQDDISVMMDDKTRERAFSSMVKAKGSEGLADRRDGWGHPRSDRCRTHGNGKRGCYCGNWRSGDAAGCRTVSGRTRRPRRGSGGRRHRRRTCRCRHRRKTRQGLREGIARGRRTRGGQAEVARAPRKVRRALSDDRTTRGEVEASTDYAGEVRQ